jgi:hypothetical protein
VCLFPPLLAQQQRVDLRNMYERLLCVVPVVGSGSADDPRRPAHAPLASAAGARLSRDGIIAYTFQLSDDGKLALVEFVAVERKAFRDLLADTDARIKIFRKGTDKRTDIEAEFKKHKKDFDLDRFGVPVL